MLDNGKSLTETPRLTGIEFARIRDLARKQAGLDLRQGKEHLVTARLGKHVRSGGFQSFAEYVTHVEGDSTGESLTNLINALTTNHTSFLREAEHFRYLVEGILPRFRQKPLLKLWCAASSSGEEPYSILFSLLNGFEAPLNPEIRLLATDISTRVLQIAERGVYSANDVASLPATWLPKYFLRGHGKSQGWYKVRREVKALVAFRKQNLIDPFPEGSFHAIFCRNVLIYFDKETQEEVVHRLTDRLEPGGHLFVGHTENLNGIGHSLKYANPAVYRKPE